MCFVNLLRICHQIYTRKNIHDLEKSISYQIIPKLMFMCQFRVMEMKISTTEGGAFGPIFIPDHC